MSDKYKSVAKRFLKGFISGAISTMVLVVIVVPANWGELETSLKGLLLAGITGGINGLLLAVQKWASWKD